MRRRRLALPRLGLLAVASTLASLPCSLGFLPPSPGSRDVIQISSSTTQESIITEKDLLLDPRSVSDRVFAKDQRPIILFDGVCNLCNNAVNLALDWDPKGRLRFSALQSNVGKALLEANGRKPDDISSIVLVTQDGAYIKSDAILKITEALNPLPFLPLKPAAIVGRYIVPQFLRDIIYDGVADNRYDLMGKRNECRFDADGEFDDRFVPESLALRTSDVL